VPWGAFTKRISHYTLLLVDYTNWTPATTYTTADN